MNRKKLIFAPVILILLLMLFFIQKKQYTTSFSRDYYALGTINEITIFGLNESKSNKLLDDCYTILNDIDNKMSVTIPSSDVSQINKNAGKNFVKVSDDTFFVIKNALIYSDLSKGNFDITIGPLSDLWGIGTENATVPSSTDIKNKLPFVSYKNISIDKSNKSVKLNKPNMKMDLGAIAKGYAADKICEYLKSNNVKSAIINLGGNIYTIGYKNNKEPFTIGIQDPTMPRGNSIGYIDSSNKSIVTSGIYERYIEQDNKIYHHILDPSTGYPFNNELSSVTIISDTSINCDALSTSVFGLGLSDGINLIESIDNTDAIFITKDKKIYLSSNIEDIFTLTDSSFEIVKK